LQQRRRKGTGSIFQRKDGLWVTRRKLFSNAPTKDYYSKSKEEAEQLMRDLSGDDMRENIIEIQVLYKYRSALYKTTIQKDDIQTLIKRLAIKGLSYTEIRELLRLSRGEKIG